jgi:HEAT repeat protein
MRKRRLFQGLGLLVLGTLLVAWAVPAWRYGILGRLRGEPFCRGHYLSYWQRALARGGESDRIVARSSLSRIGAPAVPFLVQCLGQEDAELRTHAGAALAGMAARVPLDEVVPALMAALDDPEPEVAANAAAALGFVGRDRAGEVVPRLRALLQSPRRNLRRNAEHALERLVDTSLVDR